MTADAGPASVVRRRAWAKVNLSLHVVGRRADGFHELDSLVVFAGVGDDLTAAPADDITLTVDGPYAAALDAAGDGSDNLVMRAARALQSRVGRAAGADLRLTKSLPVAAGIGGGSADAAAALHALVELWGLNVPEAELTAIAVDLGADVPACLAGRPSFVGGIGERIDLAPALPPAWLVLVNPGVPLPTAAVFAAREGPFSHPLRWHDPIADPAMLARRLGDCRNDLEPAARRLAPEIGDVLARVSGTEGCLLARMSGSGATCFGLYAEQDDATRAAEALRREQPKWWVQAAPILDS